MEPKKQRKRTWIHPSAPIPADALQQLERKYGISQDELARMAKELNYGKPKLEMHLAFLSLQKKNAGSASAS